MEFASQGAGLRFWGEGLCRLFITSRFMVINMVTILTIRYVPS